MLRTLIATGPFSATSINVRKRSRPCENSAVDSMIWAEFSIGVQKFVQLCIASMSCCGPRIFSTRFMLYARSWRLISALTLGNVFVKK